MSLRQYAIYALVSVLLITVAGCDFVPSAEDAPEATQDRSQFNAPKSVVTTGGDSQVLVQWSQYLEAQNYTLYWSNQSSLNKSTANAIAVTGNSFLHDKLTNGIPYYYALSATTQNGETNLSPVVTETPDFATLPAPAIEPIVVGDQRNTLNWSPVPGATSYSVIWSNATNGEVTLVDHRIDFVEAPFVHQNLNNNIDYHYRIFANNHSKLGTPSSVVSGTPFTRAPTAPTNITFSYSAGQVSIDFVDVSNAQYFNLYWKNAPNVTAADQKFEHIQAPFIHAPLQPNTIYYYRLSAVNSGGSSGLSAEFSVNTATGAVTAPTLGTPPSTPTNVAISLGNQQITVDWATNDPNAMGYNLYWTTGAGGVTLGDTKIANIQPPYTLTGLENGLTVNYLITAISDNGESTSTTADTAIPQIIKPGVPANVTAAAGDAKVALSWVSVSGAQDYSVLWGPSTVPVENFTDSLNQVLPPVLIDNLQNGSSYTFVVMANNAGGQSEKSIPVAATPQIPPPLAPTQIIASPGNSQVRLTWLHENTELQQVSGFNIYWSGTPDVIPQSANRIDAGLATTFLHNQLVNGRVIYYVMTAVNAGGESTPSAQTQAMPQVDFPGAPTQLEALPGNGQVTIDWQDVANAQNYNLYWWTVAANIKQSNKTVVANVAPGHTVTGLQNGVAYHFYVAALNAAGESVFSKEIITTPQVPPPSQAPSVFDAVAGDGTIQLFWDAVPKATNYKLYWSTNAAINPNSSAFFTDIESGFQHTGLANGNTYYYAISGVNPGGEGPLSIVASATPQVPAPAVPPTQLTVTGSDGEVVITWDTTNMVGVDSYNIYWTNTPTAPQSQWVKLAGFNSGDTHKQLTNGVSYYYRITAVNAGGESPYSLPLAATPQVAPPAAPSGLAASVIGGTQLTLNWFQSTGLSYNLYWATTPTVPTSGASVNKLTNAQAIYTHSGLTQDTTYYYVLTTQNPGGESAPSQVVSATPTVFPPNTPTNVSAVAGDASVAVQWQAIADTQVTYTLYWTTNATIGQQLGSQLSTATKINTVTSPFIHTGLTNGSQYYYVVTANTTVESAASAVASATPQVTPVGPPKSIVVSVGAGQVTVSWDASPYPTDTTFNLYWTDQVNTLPLNGTKIINASPPFVQTGLAANTPITYALTAQNAAGESVATQSVTVVPSAPPNSLPVIAEGLSAPAGQTHVSMSEDALPVPFQLSLNAFDNDGDTLSWIISQQPAIAGASVSISGSGNSILVDYVPAANFNGSDSFNATVADGKGGTDTILVNVTVNPINDLPQFDSVPLSTEAFTGLGYAYTIKVSDVETAPGNLLISAIELPAWLSLVNIAPGTAQIAGTPDQTYLGTTGNNVILTVTDQNGATTEQQLALVVFNPGGGTTPVNTPPQFVEASPQQVALAEDSLAYTLTLHATDDQNDVISWSIDVTPAHGSASVSGTGTTQTVSYVPQANYNGIDSFNVKISDNTEFNLLSVIVSISPQNDAPIVIAALPDTSGAVNSVFNYVIPASTFSDIDGDPLTITVAPLPPGLSFSTTNGTISGLPATVGVTNVLVTATDPSNAFITDSFIINIGANIPPAFVEGTAVTVAMSEDSVPTAFALTLNATDVENNPITWSIDTPPLKGVADVSGTGLSKSISYSPNVNANGSDSFVVKISDATGFSTLVVNVTIAPVNDNPQLALAIPDQAAKNGSPFVYTIPANTFGDVDNDPLALSANGLPGWLTFEPTAVNGLPPNTFSGTPPAEGPISVTVTASDGVVGSIAATDTFIINVGANNPPTFTVATPPVVDMSEDSIPTAFALTLDASDVDKNPITWTISQAASNGVAKIVGTGTATSMAISYDPNPNYFGTDTFTVQISDGIVGGTATQLVTVKVAAVNDAPVAAPTPIQDQTATVGVDFLFAFPAATFSDVDGDVLTYTVSPLPLPGGITFDPIALTFTGNPTAATQAPTIITVTATDPAQASASANFLLTINPNSVPTFDQIPPTPTIAEDTPLSLSLSASDIDKNTLTWSIVAPLPAQGIASISAPGTGNKATINYTPATNYNGVDSFAVQVADGVGGVVSQLVSVTITAVNDAPVAASTPIQDQTATVGVDFLFAFPAATFSDVDGDVLTYTVSPLPLPGGIVFDPVALTFTGNPTAATPAPTVITVTASDPAQASASANFLLTINPNSVPTFDQIPPTPIIAEDTPLSLSLSASDIDKNTLTWSIVAPLPAHGNASITAPSTGNAVAINYTPATNYNGPDSFAVQVADGVGGVVSQLVSVTITAVNDPPVALSTSLGAETATVGSPYSFIVPAGFFTDVDDTTLTYTVSPLPLPGGLTFNPGTQEISGTPTAATPAAINIIVTASDLAGTSASATLSLTIVAPAQPIIADVLATGVILDPALVNCIQRNAASSNPALTLVSELTNLLCDQIATDGSINNLTGIDTFSSISVVEMPNNDVVDITPLTLLPNLTQVRLGYNLVADLTPVSVFSPTLSSLDFTNNQLTDASFASIDVAQLSLLNIQQFIISNATTCTPPKCNNVSNLNTFASLPKLNSLEVKYNAVADLSSIANLPMLTNLLADGNIITNAGIAVFSQPGAFPALQVLSLVNNQIDDVADIALGQSGKQLWLLYLNNNLLGAANPSPPVGSTGGGSIDLLMPAGAGDINSNILGIGYPTLQIANNPAMPCVKLQAMIDYYTAAGKQASLQPQTASAPLGCTAITVANKSTATVPTTVIAGGDVNITIFAKDANGNSITTGGDIFSVVVTGKNANTPSVTDNNNGTYTATYKPLVPDTNADPDIVTISLGAIPISGSPFSIVVAPGGVATKSSVLTPIPDGIAGSPTTLTIMVLDAQGVPTNGGDNISVGFIAGSQNSTGAFQPTAYSGAGGVYTATYKPLVPGIDTFTITVNGQAIPDPTGAFTSNVIAGGVASKSTVAPIPAGVAGSPTTISVTVYDGQDVPSAGGDLVEVVHQSGSKNVNNTFGQASYIGSGEYQISYTPAAPGTDIFDILVNNSAIVSTPPFTSNVAPGGLAANSTATVPGGTILALTTITIVVNDKNSNPTVGGGDDVVVGYAAGSQNSDAFSTPVPSTTQAGVYTVSYTPSQSGIDKIDISVNGDFIPNSPFDSIVSTPATSALKSTAVVPITSVVDTPLNISIQAVDTNGNDKTTGGDLFQIVVTDPNALEKVIIPLDKLDGTYIANFTPTIVGTHSVKISFGGAEILGSPFTSNILPGGDIPVPTAFVPLAKHLNIKLKYNNVGDGVAAWLVDSFTGYKLVCSLNIGGIWQAEQDLAYFPDTRNVPSFDLETNGSGFMIAWYNLQLNQIVANNNSGGVWQGNQTIGGGNLGTPAGVPKLDTNGIGYIASWRAGNVFANVYSGSTWQGPTQISPTTLASVPSLPQVTSNGTSYLIAWTQSAPNSSGINYVDIFASFYNGVIWSTVFALDFDALAISVGNYRIASQGNGGNYLLVWQQGEYYSRIFDPLAVVNPWGGTEIVAAIGATSYLNPDSKLVSNGNTYAILWVDSTFTNNWAITGTPSAGGMVWNQAMEISQGLPNPSLGTVTKQLLSTNGNGYLAVWLQGGVLYANANNSIWSNTDTTVIADYTNSTTTSIYSLQPIQIEKIGNEYALAWTTTTVSSGKNEWIALHNGNWKAALSKPRQGFSTDVQNNFVIRSNGISYVSVWTGTLSGLPHAFESKYMPGNTVWDADINIDQLNHHLSNYDVNILSAANGNKLATWKEHSDSNSSNNDRLYASVFSQGIWTAPKLITHSYMVKDTYVNFEVKTATNGNGFAIAWMRKLPSNIGENVDVAAFIWDGSWQPFTIVQQYSGTQLIRQPYDIESNGSGYLLAWGIYGTVPNVAGVFGEVRTSRFDGKNWLTDPAPLFNYPGTFSAQLLSLDVDSDGSGYGVVYETSSTNPKSVNLHVYSDAKISNTFVWSPALPVSTNGLEQKTPRLVSDGNSYAVRWISVNDSYVNIFHILTQNWEGETLLTTPGSGYVELISNHNNGYAFVWVQGTNVFSRVYENNVWTTPVPQLVLTSLVPSNLRPVLVSNGIGYAVTTIQNMIPLGSGIVINRSVYQNGAWLSDSSTLLNRSVDDPSMSPSIIRRELGDLASNGKGYALTFQANLANNLFENYIVRFDNSMWLDPIPLGLSASPSYAPALDGAIGSYTAIWLQADPKELSVRVPYFNGNF